MINFNSLNYYQKINFIFRNITTAISIFGILGNILVICVFSRKSLRKYPYSFYSQIKACGDCVILLYCINTWSSFTFNADLDLVNAFFCKFDLYFVYVMTIMCLSFLVLISMDRLVSIAYPNRFKFLKTTWFKISILGVIITYSFLVNMILPLNTNLIVLGTGNQTTKRCDIDFDAFTKQSWLSVGHNIAIIFLANNILIIKLVWFITSSRRKIANNIGNNQRTSSKDRKFAISAIGLSLVAFGCKLPLSVTIIVTSMINLTDLDLHFAIISIDLTILAMENAASFYVNLSLNSLFYQEVRQILGLSSFLETTTTTKNNNTNTADKNNKTLKQSS